jgi:hypothetical protein
VRSSNADQWLRNGPPAPDTPLPVVLRIPGLFLAFADSLIHEGKWRELVRLLNQDDTPFSPAKVELMRAHCSNGLSEPSANIDAHLNAGLLYATKARSREDLSMVVETAERLNRLPVAILACERLASKPLDRFDVLKRMFSLQQRVHEIDGMVATARAILELKPDLAPYNEMLPYLRLLSGIEIEGTSEEVLKAFRGGDAPGDSMRRLTAALAAYEGGEMQTARGLIDSLDSASLPPGPRAVLAGLLAQTGEASKAFGIAEKIPAGNLLSPERWFRDLALR